MKKYTKIVVYGSDYKAIVIGGSAGSFPVVKQILSGLNPLYRQSLFFCLHRLKESPNGLVESLAHSCSLPLGEPEDKELTRPGRVYFAPANYHMLIETTRHIALSIDDEVHFSRPSIDLTFESAGIAYRKSLLVILLSGANKDGGEGMLRAGRNGATTVVQDPDEAMVRTMPAHALELYTPDYVMTADKISEFVQKIASC